MRYYTKSWYNLLQQTNDTSLLTPIPDNPYSDSDIHLDTIDKARAWIEKENGKHHYKRYPILLKKNSQDGHEPSKLFF